MEKVLGFGGLFFRADNPAKLAAWYHQHLGVDPVPGDYETPAWQQEAGTTVFAPFDRETKYFGNDDTQFMVNFRVRDLDAMIAQLEAAGISVTRDPEAHPNGHFARLADPEGNPIELWQPV
ncbi:MAG: VOC family protein [Albidovulum sp.]